MPLIADGVPALKACLKHLREKNGLVPKVVTAYGNPRVHISIENAGGEDVSDWVTFENLDAFVEAVTDIYEKNGISQWQKYSIGCREIIDDAPAHAETYRRADNDPRPVVRDRDPHPRVLDETPDIGSTEGASWEAQKRRMLLDGCTATCVPTMSTARVSEDERAGHYSPPREDFMFSQSDGTDWISPDNASSTSRHRLDAASWEAHKRRMFEEGCTATRVPTMSTARVAEDERAVAAELSSP